MIYVAFLSSLTFSQQPNVNLGFRFILLKEYDLSVSSVILHFRLNLGIQEPEIEFKLGFCDCQ